MNRIWMLSIFLISLSLLLVLKTHEKRTLVPYYKSERPLKLSHFTEARKHVSNSDLYLLELWESMLTGRVAPLDRWLRQEYKALSLAHVFTPSGFHLSALLWPLLLLFRKRTHKRWLLGMMGTVLTITPGMSALKRMTLVKLLQQFTGMKTGFLIAFLMDLLFGSFDGSPLGFTYSFLFLGIIYSGARGFPLIIWFFAAQVVIAFAQGTFISPLLLFTTPVINSFLALILPFLFLLSWPLASWQLTSGIFLLNLVQAIVSFFYAIVMKFPLLEVNAALLLFFIFLSFRQGRLALITCLLLCTDVNPDKGKIPMPASYEWVAKGRVIKMVGKKIYREDGICERELVRGMWFETCSPRRRSRRKET